MDLPEPSGSTCCISIECVSLTNLILKLKKKCDLFSGQFINYVLQWGKRILKDIFRFDRWWDCNTAMLSCQDGN